LVMMQVSHAGNLAFVPEDCPYKKIEANKAILAQDIPNYDMSQHFDEAIAFIEEQLNAGRNLLVHCHAGVSRSATVMIAYLMTKNQWNYDDALAFLRTKRKWVRPNPGFEKQLRDYEARL
jgi:protein-tyrosine phosphatase